MAAFWRDFLGAWEGYRVDAEEYRELDDERVLVLIRIGGRGKSSGLDVGELGKEAANLLRLHDGKVTRLVLYWDREPLPEMPAIDGGIPARARTGQ
jgi:hypothetical protein